MNIGALNNGTLNTGTPSSLYGSKDSPTQAGLSRGDSEPGKVRLSAAKRAQRTLLRLLCLSAPALGDGLAWRHFTRPRRLARYDPQSLPKGAQGFRLPYKKAHLSGYVWGEGDKTVYLVHGWESHLGHMAGFVAPPLGAGYRVVAFDMPGHGRSAGGATDLLDFAGALEHVIEAKGAAYGVVAHSCGATATLLSLARNSRVPARVALVAPMRSLEEHVAIFATVAGLSAHAKNRLVTRLEAQLGSPLSETDALKTAARLPSGGLILHDRDDRFIPHSTGQAVATAWRSALHTTTGLGHRKILSDPEVIRKVSSYLTNEASPSQPSPLTRC